MEITRGIIKGATKVVIYGPEGIGKSTFAAEFPSPLFIDTEGSTKHMDVCRTKPPTSWAMLLDQIRYMKTTPDIFKTLVIDTVDWAEQLCIESICAKYDKKGIEDFGYGNGYVYAKEEFGRFLNLLSDVIDIGINVVLTAHAQLRKFEQPDESGAYDRYELKLGKKTGSQTSPLLKEWADMLLFANYKTFVVKDDSKDKKGKAKGGQRVMHTTHHPCWDAKNRQGLAEELLFDYAAISHCITAQDGILQDVIDAKQAVKSVEPPKKEETTPVIPETQGSVVEALGDEYSSLPDFFGPLVDLLKTNAVKIAEIKDAVTQKGYYTASTPIENYAQEFVEGVLIGAWSQVFEMIKQRRLD